MVDNGLTQNVMLATVRFKVISELVFYFGPKRLKTLFKFKIPKKFLGKKMLTNLSQNLKAFFDYKTFLTSS